MAMTLVLDAVLLGSTIGRVFQSEYDHAWFVTGIATVLYVAAVSVAMLLLGAAADMESPFGDDPMDLPGLSYVAAAAESTLTYVLPPSLAASNAKREITTVDSVKLLSHHDLAEAHRRGCGGTTGGDPLGVISGQNKRHTVV
jgi:hypothetical protein